MINHVRCRRCSRVMPADELRGPEVLLTLEDDDGTPWPWSCPQCRYTDAPVAWVPFALPERKVVEGTWRAMMVWRRAEEMPETRTAVEEIAKNVRESTKKASGGKPPAGR